MAAVALVWLWLQLYHIVLLIVVSILLAVTLHPVVRWFERRGLARWAAASIVCLAIAIVVGGFLWVTWASLSAQAQFASQHFGELEQTIVSRLPEWVRGSLGIQSGSDVTSAIGSYAMRLARSVTSAIILALLGFILTVYLLIEHRRTYDWMMAFVPARNRDRVARTLDESETVIFGYVAGNVATSVFAFTFVIVALSILKVPAALLLAVLAFLCDFIPVIGFILSALPAILLAAGVSPGTALIVGVLYVTYHTLENYLIAPYVYGDRLKLSNVAVILAFAVGAELAGVIGALIALPVAAVYPSIERIWLREQLPEDTVKEHRAIERRKAG